MKTVPLSDHSTSQVRPFFGRHPTTMDSEGRIRLCSEVLRQLQAWGAEEVWVAAMADEPALAVFPPAQWGKWVQEQRARYGEMSEMDVQRLLLSNAAPARWDKKGRMKINVAHRKHCGLKPESLAVIVGMVNRFEIWELPRFEQTQKDRMEQLRGSGIEHFGRVERRIRTAFSTAVP